MGCDIHLVLEEKWSHSRMWNAVYEEEIKIWRNYGVFCELAGVRGPRTRESGLPINPISEPRGLPVDLSDFAQEFFSENARDFHSHSWISWQEFKGRWPLESCLTSQFARSVWAVFDDFGPEYRLVFAFDN